MVAWCWFILLYNKGRREEDHFRAIRDRNNYEIRERERQKDRKSDIKRERVRERERERERVREREKEKEIIERERK